MNRSEFNAINVSVNEAREQCVHEIEAAVAYLYAAKHRLEGIPTEAAYAQLLCAGVTVNQAIRSVSEALALAEVLDEADERGSDG